MGVLDALRHLRNPTRAWVEEKNRPLEFDFSKHALNGVRLGDPLSGLAFLGRAETWRPSLEYPARGLAVDYTSGAVESFVLYLAPGLMRGSVPYRGQFRYEGSVLVLNADTRESRLAARFGEPYWRSADDDEILLFYEFGLIEWQFELSRAGTLRTIIVTTPPLLADPEQRRFYGVTKPPETPPEN